MEPIFIIQWMAQTHIAGTLCSDTVSLALGNGSYRVVLRVFETNEWGAKSEENITIASN